MLTYINNYPASKRSERVEIQKTRRDSFKEETSFSNRVKKTTYKKDGNIDFKYRDKLVKYFADSQKMVILDKETKAKRKIFEDSTIKEISPNGESIAITYGDSGNRDVFKGRVKIERKYGDSGNIKKFSSDGDLIELIYADSGNKDIFNGYGVRIGRALSGSDSAKRLDNGKTKIFNVGGGVKILDSNRAVLKTVASNPDVLRALLADGNEIKEFKSKNILIIKGNGIKTAYFRNEAGDLLPLLTKDSGGISIPTNADPVKINLTTLDAGERKFSALAKKVLEKSLEKGLSYIR